LRNRRTEQPNAAHPRHDLAIETLFEIILARAGKQISLSERASIVAHKLLVFAELAVETERIVLGEGSRGLTCLCDALFSPALRTNAGLRTHGVFRSDFDPVWIERGQRPVVGAGAAGGPLGVPKKRKKSDFGLTTIRVSPPFNPVS
jgi:hypothetical protein